MDPLLLHEMLDRTCLIAENFSYYVAEHPMAQHPELQASVIKIEGELFDLYQKVANLV